ncbi:MAG: response regulator [Spirochaetales bacterium]|nr:response regulator [Spirochaetales bacterium]
MAPILKNRTNGSAVTTLFLLSLLALFPLEGEDRSSQKNIYIINSQGPETENMNPMVDEQVRVIEKTYPFSEYFIYSLDNDRLEERVYGLIYDELELALQTFPADLVIVNGYDAYFFVLHRREELFGEAPLLFSGVTDWKRRIPVLPPGVTGIPDIMDIRGIIDTALMVQPKTKNLYLILDRRMSKRDILPSYLEESLDYYGNRLNITVLRNTTVQEAGEILAKAEENSVALMYPLITNEGMDGSRTENPYEPLTGQNRVPVYSFYDFTSPVGVVGGYISSPSTYGRLSAQVAVRILNGEDPSSLPVPERGFQELILDYRVLKKYRIPLRNVPDQAIIINKPFAFYQEYKYLVWAVISLFIILIAVITILTLSILWRRKFQRELTRLKCYLSSIINSMPSVLISVDREGKICLWNDAAVKRTGWEEERARGELFSQVFPDYREELVKISESLYQKTGLTIPEKEIKREGKITYENITIFPLLTDEAEEVVFRIDDITRERELLNKLNHKSRMDAIGAVSAGVAHDFNNMLGGITGAAQVILSSEKSLSGTSRELLNQVLSSAFKSAELTRKLLVFSRKKKLDSTAVDIHEILDESVTILQRTLEKTIRFTVKKEAVHSTLIGDNSSLQNSLMNLGINASHAMEGGGELSFTTKNITLSEEDCGLSDFDIVPGEYIRLEVGDTGCGISPEIIDHIFEPFFTTKGEEKGTGLGLSTVYGTIKDHAGALAVKSVPGEGTTFILDIPCTEEAANADLDRPDFYEGKGSILLVDDEELMRVTGKYLLEKMGYRVITASNGQEALDYYKSHSSSLDAVLMDMIMPVLNGRDCFYLMREVNPRAKIIISSGFSSPESLKELKKDGLAGFISKPFKDSELSRIVFKVLNR